MTDVTVMYSTDAIHGTCVFSVCGALGSCQHLTISPCFLLPAAQWDAFSIPELQNFLTILEKEEQDKIQQVQKKYNKFRQKLEEALRESQGKPG